jgi:hypothetical protein
MLRGRSAPPGPPRLAEGDPLGGYAADNGERFDIIEDARTATATASRSAMVLRAAASRAAC